MKARVITTITTVMDLETMRTDHTVEVVDEDKLSEVSREVFGTVVLAALLATQDEVMRQFPRAGAAAKRKKKEKRTD